MNSEPELELVSPWLVAVWPGMGGVAQIAGSYLLQQLGAREVARVPPRDFFEVRSIHVEQGLMKPPEPPKSLLYAWQDPAGRRDLLIFVGEQQPAQRGFEFCEELLDVARRFGVARVFTFAAMASPTHPAADARVFAVGSHPKLLDELRQRDVEVLHEGEISGLNGVFLAAAAARGIDGICLLGEFPFFAGAVPNPKASRAVLRVLAGLAGIELDFGALDEQVSLIEQRLCEHFERMQQQAGGELPLLEWAPGADDATQAAARESGKKLPRKARARIEKLFEAARLDRSRAMELKAELDRHGVFERYEDRFLDLFRRAE